MQAKADVLAAEIESLKDEVKAEMTVQGVDEMIAGSFKVSYKDVTSNRFDTTSFKKLHSDIYNMFVKATTSKRFTIG